MQAIGNLIFQFVSRVIPAVDARHSLTMSKEQRPAPGQPDDFFLNGEGLWIYTRYWLPSDGSRPKAVIFLLHGMGEHCGRYVEFAQHLVGQGYAVYSMDHQGHGRSEGDRLHVQSFERFVVDALDMMKRVLSGERSGKVPGGLAGLPVFLIGHSMGGLIAINTALATQTQGPKLAGVVLCGPAIKPDPTSANAVNLFLLPRLSAILPKLALSWEKGPAFKFAMTHDDAVTAAFKSDPLVYKGGIRVGFVWSFIQTMTATLAAAPSFTLPYLLVHGSEDKACLVAGSAEWHAKTGSKDKAFHPIQGGYHELFMEADEYRKPVLGLVDGFLAARLAAR